MDRAASGCLSRRSLVRRLASGLWMAGIPIFGTGCVGFSVGQDLPQVTPVAPAAPTPHLPIQQVGPVTPGVVEPVVPPHEVPITLDAVLRLAEDHNPRIGLAREKLNESQLVQAQSCNAWLPNTYAGVAYYRHEGGIQDFNGNLIHSSTQALYPGMQIQSELDLREATFKQLSAERQVWQQKAELSQVNSEILLEAATTYIDLLVARRGAVLAADLEKCENNLLSRAEKLAKAEAGMAGLISAVKAAMSNHQRLRTQLTHQGNAASARLVYLLGLPPETCLTPVDLMLAPVELVDVTPPVHDLVAHAMANGPAVQELEKVINVIQTGIDRTYGIHALLPTLQVNAMEGAFGAGPGASMAWDNRLDIGLSMRWNLTQFATAEAQRQQARSRQTQAMLSYQDLQGKLAAGVQEARESIYSGREQIGMSIREIEEANKSYSESERMMQDGLTANTAKDTLGAVRAMEQAHFSHLTSISSHNKAQVRLLLLLGAGSAKEGPACHQP